MPINFDLNKYTIITPIDLILLVFHEQFNAIPNLTSYPLVNYETLIKELKRRGLSKTKGYNVCDNEFDDTVLRGTEVWTHKTLGVVVALSGKKKHTKAVVYPSSLSYDELFTCSVTVGYANEKDSLKEFLVSNSFESIKSEARAEIHFLCSSSGLYLKSKPYKTNLNVDLAANYGDDFIDIDRQIQDVIKADKSGLIVLQSPPGAGKTSYIRYLIGQKLRRVIYIPSNLLGELASPQFLDFLLSDAQDSLVIAEDAEQIVSKRTGGSSDAAVSNLLNATDGIIADGLNLKIICTFNTNLDNIDQALTRKGRLLFYHEFKPLSIDDSNRLLKKIGSDFVADKPMLLCDIYNLGKNNNGEKLTKPENLDRIVGFGQA